MPEREPAQPYEPNPLLGMVLQRVFSSLEPDPRWRAALEAHEREGHVVHVLPTRSAMEFLALDHITKRNGLRRLRFVSDPGLWIFNPLGKGWLNALLPHRRSDPGRELQQALTKGGSAVLFLKRRANVIDVATASVPIRSAEPKEADQLALALLEFQRQSERPVLLVPQLFFWTLQPDRTSLKMRDLLLGPPDSPSAPLATMHLFANSGGVRLAATEPINLRNFLEQHPGIPDELLVRRLVYAVLRRLARERRGVLGPVARAPERLRADVVRSPKVRDLIDDLSGQDPKQAAELRAKALDLTRELQAVPEPFVIALFGRAMHSLFHRMYAGVEMPAADIARLRDAARTGSLIILPSHKSHSDYLVMSYQFARLGIPVPAIAAGENLDFFPMGPLFRRCNAFFIRRSFKGDRLYAAIVDAYVRRLIRDGYSIEVFIEGGRSRTGKLLAPKVGLLNMLVDATLAEPDRQTFFAPISIGYERIAETHAYHRELTGGEKRKESARDLLRASRMLRERFGRVNLQVGEFITLQELREQIGVGPTEVLKPAKRRALVARLAQRTMDEINRVTAATPGSIVAAVLMSHGKRGLSHDELVERSRLLLELVRRAGGRISTVLQTSSGSLRVDTIREAAQLFADAELIEVHRTADVAAPKTTRRGKLEAGHGVFYTVNESKRLELDTSKNITLHFFVERALVALAWFAAADPGATRDQLTARVATLSALFQFEFRLASGQAAVDSANRLINEFIELGWFVEPRPGHLELGPGDATSIADKSLRQLATLIVNYLEGYRVAARSLSVLLDGSMLERDLIKRAMAIGNRMYFAGEISRGEAVNKALLENAFGAFAATGAVRHRDGKLELPDSTATAEDLAAIEAPLAQLLRGVST